MKQFVYYTLAFFSPFLMLQTAAAYIHPTDAPMNEARLIQILNNRQNTASGESLEIKHMPQLLSEGFLLNFILKHGRLIDGPRGHLTDVVSQSASPENPRVIMWDESTGFSLSYNGNGPGQTHGNRLDLLSFNSADNTFELKAIDFPVMPGSRVQAHSVTAGNDACMRCHGPHQRPIFSMYPDWPSFYGSDNDELLGSTPTQRAELQAFRAFREKIETEFRNGLQNESGRYAPLFSASRIQRLLNFTPYSTFPLRPNLDTDLNAVSRAFAFRPQLRMGILYNRLNAKNIFARMKAHPNYRRVAPYFLFNLMQCQPRNAASLPRGHAIAQSILQRTPRLHQGRLHFRDLWALLDLKINDVDIRYSYNHQGYNNDNAAGKIMEVGYIGAYFNSYFDGSATIDEIIAASMYQDLSVNPAIGFTDSQGRLLRDARGNLLGTRGLVDKYQRFAARFNLDRAFFTKMDEFARWFPLPVPDRATRTEHHRETYTEAMAANHARLCRNLEGQF